MKEKVLYAEKELEDAYTEAKKDYNVFGSYYCCKTKKRLDMPGVQPLVPEMEKLEEECAKMNGILQQK